MFSLTNPYDVRMQVAGLLEELFTGSAPRNDITFTERLLRSTFEIDRRVSVTAVLRGSEDFAPEILAEMKYVVETRVDSPQGVDILCKRAFNGIASKLPETAVFFGPASDWDNELLLELQEEIRGRRKKQKRVEKQAVDLRSVTNSPKVRTKTSRVREVTSPIEPTITPPVAPALQIDEFVEQSAKEEEAIPDEVQLAPVVETSEAFESPLMSEGTQVPHELELPVEAAAVEVFEETIEPEVIAEAGVPNLESKSLDITSEVESSVELKPVAAKSLLETAPVVGSTSYVAIVQAMLPTGEQREHLVRAWYARFGSRNMSFDFNSAGFMFARQLSVSPVDFIDWLRTDGVLNEFEAEKVVAAVRTHSLI